MLKLLFIDLLKEIIFVIQKFHFKLWIIKYISVNIDLPIGLIKMS
jgi:hypothetical protein